MLFIFLLSVFIYKITKKDKYKHYTKYASPHKNLVITVSVPFITPSYCHQLIILHYSPLFLFFFSSSWVIHLFFSKLKKPHCFLACACNYQVSYMFSYPFAAEDTRKFQKHYPVILPTGNMFYKIFKIHISISI